MASQAISIWWWRILVAPKAKYRIRDRRSEVDGSDRADLPETCGEKSSRPNRMDASREVDEPSGQS